MYLCKMPRLPPAWANFSSAGSFPGFAPLNTYLPGSYSGDQQVAYPSLHEDAMVLCRLTSGMSVNTIYSIAFLLHQQCTLDQPTSPCRMKFVNSSILHRLISALPVLGVLQVILPNIVLGSTFQYVSDASRFSINRVFILIFTYAGLSSI